MSVEKAAPVVSIRADCNAEIGYGHIMLLNLRNAVDPLSRGVLVDPFEPDYPPLSFACDDARRQGGIVILCHNGQGMEAPVAAVLGKVDAFNLFDPYWMDPEYDIYYQMLNAGFRLPASTGSDWFISSANRVYAYTGAEFEYEESDGQARQRSDEQVQAGAEYLWSLGRLPEQSAR